MSQRVRVTTKFDCTTTGTTGHFRANLVPYQDRAGQTIANQQDWQRSRNQQRNWETITQIISLFTQLENLSDCGPVGESWCFEFTTEFEGVFQNGRSELGALEDVCRGVPMITDVAATDCGDKLDPGTNIQFEIVG